MISNIEYLIEKEAYEIEEIIKKFVEGSIDIDACAKELQEKSLKMSQNIHAETLKMLDQTIKTDPNR